MGRVFLGLQCRSSCLQYFGESYVKFKQANQICSPLEINQSINVETLNGAHVIEKKCTVAFTKARNSLVVQYIFQSCC